MKQITDKEWEQSNSRWVYLTYFWFTAPFAFFHIGRKGKKKEWTLVGWAYMIILAFMIYIDDENSEEMSDAYGGALLALLVVGIVLAYRFKKEYLIRLDLLQREDQQSAEDERLRQRVAQDLFKDKSRSNAAAKPKRKSDPVRKPVQAETAPAPQALYEEPVAKPEPAVYAGSPLDINSCTAEELSQLPGVSIIQAKKAVKHRQEQGGFASEDEFYQILALKPHFIVQVADKIVCQPYAAAPAPHSGDPAGPAANGGQSVGRQLDL